MRVYIVCLIHKKSFGFIEVIKTFMDKVEAEKFRDQRNISRQFHKMVINEYEVAE